jgi:DNA topoisomerase VI subunit B
MLQNPGLSANIWVSSEVFNGVAHLEKVTDELEDSWKKVAKELNKEEHTRDISRRNTDEKPDINKLAKLMKDAQKKITDKRETKMGKAKEWFHRVVGTLNSHTWLFDILPSNDKYFSVLVGALTACIKVGVESLPL